MNIVYFGKGPRAATCFQALLKAGYTPTLVVGSPKDQGEPNSLMGLARQAGLSTYQPADPNAPEATERLQQEAADLFILGGYGPIIRQHTIDLPRLMCINLHGGKLPDYRGSSPMNWSLINGETEHGASIIQVDSGVDTGPILASRTFAIGPNDTIADLHGRANQAFPEMLVEVVQQLEAGTLKPQVQDRSEGAYYPLRFPNDGFVLLDGETAQSLHNKIRALTRPYPCAFTYFNGRKVLLIKSEVPEFPTYGEAGRVYRKTKKGLLLCAADRCLWITEARFEDDDSSLFDAINRYDTLPTAKAQILQQLKQGNP